MTSISSLTPIKYARSSSCAEGALSTLSQYFYLGGSRATVVKGYEVRLENGKVSWMEIALKVASYILLFPITLALLAINLALHSRYHFTVIIPHASRKLSIEPLKESMPRSSSPIKTEPPQKITRPITSKPQQNPIIEFHKTESTTVFPDVMTTTKQTSIINPDNEKKEEESHLRPSSIMPESEPEISSNKTAQSVERVRQQVIIPSETRAEPIFHLSEIKIADRAIPDLTSIEAMRLKARELGQEIFDRHISLRLDVPKVWSPERQQALQFIQELRTVADIVATRWTDLFYIVPKKTEEVQNYSILRRYDNGVIEEVDTVSNGSGWEDWKGRRIYPNGKIESGKFERFRLVRGTYVEGEITTYRLPVTLASNYKIDRHLIYSNAQEKRLIVIHKKPDADSRDYIEINEQLIPTLTNILKEDNSVQKNDLQEILSGPINHEEFIRTLFETNSIFSLKQNSLENLLKIVHEKGWTINLHQKHPETQKTLLEYYLDDREIVRTLLAIDPTLIQRTDGIESIFVRALLMNAKDEASIISTTMQNQGIALSPRELLFKKVAFKEEITLEELQTRENQEIVYQLANIYSRLDVLRILRTLSFNRREELLMHEGPSIFGYNMDALEMHELLKDFLANLRSQGFLLTQSEFNQRHVENCRKKSADLEDLGRLLGRNYIEKKANELGLTHIKVPKKFIVIKDDAKIELQVDQNLKLNVASYEDNIWIYDEQIQESDRKITIEEMSELIRLFESTGYFYSEGIVIAEDGIYIISTAFRGFWNVNAFKNGKRYENMKEFVRDNLPAEQQQTFIDELDAKMATYRQQEEALNAQHALRKNVEEAALKKTGCFYEPSFTFTAHELCV